jgi:excisionase family DNA binding protein
MTYVDHIQPTLTTEELAEILSCTPQTVRTMRRRGNGPKYVVLTGGHVRYTRESVDSWLNGENDGKK